MLWYAANHSIGTAFGIIHGFDRVDEFWESPDMDGVPIIGTYIIFITRTISAASFVGAIIYLVPSYRKQVAIITVAVVCVVTAGVLGFLLFEDATSDPGLSLEGWYKHILDMLSIMFGATAGAWLARRSQRRRIKAS
jgi:hypothetical protein